MFWHYTLPRPAALGLCSYVGVGGAAGCIVTMPCSLMSGTQAHSWESYHCACPGLSLASPQRPRRAVTSMWFAQMPCLVLRKPPFLKGLPAFCCLFCSLTPFLGLFSNLLTLAP